MLGGEINKNQSRNAFGLYDWVKACNCGEENDKSNDILTCLHKCLKRMFLVALGVVPPAPLPGLATVGLVSKQNIEGDGHIFSFFFFLQNSLLCFHRFVHTRTVLSETVSLRVWEQQPDGEGRRLDTSLGSQCCSACTSTTSSTSPSMSIRRHWEWNHLSMLRRMWKWQFWPNQPILDPKPWNAILIIDQFEWLCFW